MTTARLVHYPESDGKPMGETELHIRELIRLLQTLWERFEQRPDVYVGGDLILYYEEGNSHRSVVPDLFVALGASKEPQRRIYKLWEERVPPTMVIEVTSRGTAREDRRGKRTLYARLGVREYFLYDPLAEYLTPPLQGLRLAGNAYVDIPPEADGSLLSDALGLRLQLVNGRLRLFDAATGVLLLDPIEQQRIARQQAEIAQARADVERAQAEAERARAEEERALKEFERQRADAEAAARRELEERVAELEARLRERAAL